MNRVILIGHLGQDPEVKYTPSGTAVANMSLATNERFKKDGEWTSRTEWHSLVVWDKLAETAGEYLKKGSHVAIEGKLQTRNWEDKDSGKKVYKTEVVVEKLEFLDKKDDNRDGGDQRRSENRSSSGSKSGNVNRTTSRAQNNPEIDDSDIPF